MKRRIKDFIKKLYANRLGEWMIIPFVKQKNPDMTMVKFIPGNHLYRRGSLREVKRFDLNFEFDISDYVDWYAYFQLNDPGLNFYFSKLKDSDTIIDIGANIGFTTLCAARICHNGTVISFEPSSHNLKKCLRNIELNNPNNVRVFPLGVGSESKFLYLHVRHKTNLGMNQVAMESDGNEKIEIITLDEWIPANSISKVDVIKIDVEGFEMEVLKGAESVIRKFRPKLFIEVNNQFLKSFGSSALQLISWLKTMDYRIMNIQGIQ